jgi:signal transduction histidine kinase
MTELLTQVAPASLGYALVFGLAGLVCLASIPRAQQVEKPDVRRGLVWLLLTSGGWALFKLAFLLVSGPRLVEEVLYTVGLAVGFGTVWAWLYFCSAYTGRTYHRRPRFRQLAGGIFTAVVIAKFTNPIHEQYFSLAESTTPFTYLAVNHGPIHWVATGLSYTLAAVGLFMLYELYIESGYDTRPLAALSVLLGLPVVLDLLALWTPLIEIIYAPLGVAAFTVGVLFVFERRFLAVQEAGEDDGPAVFLDSNGRVQDYTPAAKRAFPELTDGLGRPLDEVAPELEGISEDSEQLVESERDSGVRYYMTATSDIELGEVGGQMVVLSDVTAAERRRRELARHNEQLEEFASALTHELRNVIQIIDSRLAVASVRMDAENEPVAHESVERAGEMTDRMSGLVDDFRSLARYGQTVEQLRPVEFAPAVRDAWALAETDGLALTVEGEATIDADPGRLRQLLVNAFEFARHNGASAVRAEPLAEGFAITEDGDSPTGDTSRYFAFGEAVPDAESGMKLPNVRAFARVHGWTVDVDTDYDRGTRLVVREVSVRASPSNRSAVAASSAPVPQDIAGDEPATGSGSTASAESTAGETAADGESAETEEGVNPAGPSKGTGI